MTLFNHSGPVKFQKSSQLNSNLNDNHSQIRLFPGNPTPQNSKPKEIRPTNLPQSSLKPQPKALAIVPVPSSEFEGWRFFLECGDWKFSVQLQEFEANRLLEQLASLDWTVDGQGVPTDLQRIYAIAEQELRRLWATLRLIGKGGEA